MVEFVSSTFLAFYLLTKSMPIASANIVGVPPLPKDPKKAKVFAAWLLREIDEVRQVCEESRSVDLAFVGIGAAIPSRDIFSEYGKLGYSFDYMQQKGAIGGINYNYFDMEGRQISEGILTMSINDLRELSADSSKTIVIVGGGTHKRKALEVSIKTRMANALITDEGSARYLIRKSVD